MNSIIDYMIKLRINKNISKQAINFLLTSKLDPFMIEDTLLGAEEIAGNFISEKNIIDSFRFKYFMDVYQLNPDSVFTILPEASHGFDKTTLYYLNNIEFSNKLMLSDIYKSIKHQMDDIEIKQIIYMNSKTNEMSENGILFRDVNNDFIYFSPDDYHLSLTNLDFLKHRAYSTSMDFAEIYIPDLEAEYYYFNYNLYLDSPVNLLNEKFLKKLQQLIDSYTSKEDQRRKTAFIRFKEIVEKFGKPITVENKAELYKFKGVGPSSRELVEDFLKTGTFSRLKETPADLEKQRIIKEFTTIYGIGDITATKLYNEGFRSLTDLDKHKSQFTKAQQLGLRYRGDLEKRIPRKEIDQIKEFISPTFDSFGIKEWHVMGSYLRGKPDSGDIDILVKAVPGLTMDLLMDRLLQLDNLSGKEFIVGTLAQGDVKFLGLIRLSDNLPVRRLDIFLALPEYWATYYLYAVGSKRFNEKMRDYANKKGFSISEYAVTNIITGEKYPVQTEEEIFDLIDLPYIKAEDRN